MATVLYEGPHAQEFILSEAAGNRSRENGTVAMGQVLKAGQIVMMSGGKLVAQTGTLASAGALATAPAGIVNYNVDATAADVKVSYMARECEVNGWCVTFPTETTAGGQKAASVASLARNQIIVRF